MTIISKASDTRTFAIHNLCYAGFIDNKGDGVMWARLLLTIVTFSLIMIVIPLQSQDLDENTIVVMAWSYDSRYLAMGYYSDRIDIVDMETGNTVNQIFPSDYRSVTGLAWSPNSQYLASGSTGGSVNIWNPLSGQLLTSIPDLPNDYASLLSWSPNSQLLVVIHDSSAGAEFNLNIWDVGLSEFVYQRNIPTAMDTIWSPDGSIIAIAMASESIMLLDSSTFSRIGHVAFDPYDFTSVLNGTVVNIAWHPDNNRIAYGTNTGTVIVWDLTTQQALFTLSGNESHDLTDGSKEIDELWFSLNGSTVSSISGNGLLHTWTTETGQLLTDYQLPNILVLDAAVSPDKTTLAFSTYGTDGVHSISLPLADPEKEGHPTPNRRHRPG